MRRIQAKKHEPETWEINKKSLSVFDDKRFVSKDGIHMRAYFDKDFSQKKRDSHKRKRC